MDDEKLTDKNPAYDPANYAISKEDAANLRTAYLQGPMREYVRRFMQSHPQVLSCTIKVAQYYNDEAGDAVHFRMFPSVLTEWYEPPPPKPFVSKKGRTIIPTPPNYYYLDLGEEEARDVFSRNLPFVQACAWDERPRTRRYVHSISDVISRWENRELGWSHWLNSAAWHSNGACISLFSAFCEGENYVPLCIFRRLHEDPDKVEMEFVGEMRRPERDGIKPDVDEDCSDYFRRMQKSIDRCALISTGPLEDIKAHIQRRNLLSEEDERIAPQGLVLWGLRGPCIPEEEVERISGNQEALEELQAEWERRKQWDIEFSKRYEK